MLLIWGLGAINLCWSRSNLCILCIYLHLVDSKEWEEGLLPKIWVRVNSCIVDVSNLVDANKICAQPLHFIGIGPPPLGSARSIKPFHSCLQHVVLVYRLHVGSHLPHPLLQCGVIIHISYIMMASNPSQSIWSSSSLWGIPEISFSVSPDFIFFIDNSNKIEEN